MSPSRSTAARATRPFRVFVTATDTGVGKTQVAAALLSLLADAGLSPAPFKPYESGCTRLSRPHRDASRSGRSTVRNARRRRSGSSMNGTGPSTGTP